VHAASTRPRAKPREWVKRSGNLMAVAGGV
jgi:hypothetical protein